MGFSENQLTRIIRKAIGSGEANKLVKAYRKRFTGGSGIFEWNLPAKVTSFSVAFESGTAGTVTITDADGDSSTLAVGSVESWSVDSQYAITCPFKVESTDAGNTVIINYTKLT